MAFCVASQVFTNVKNPGAHIILHSCVVTGKVLSGLGFNKIVKETMKVTMDTNQPIK